MSSRDFSGEYREKSERSLLVSEVRGVLKAAEVFEAAGLGGGLIADALVSVTDVNGEECAQVWWDGEAEQWVIDFGKGWVRGG